MRIMNLKATYILVALAIATLLLALAALASNPRAAHAGTASPTPTPSPSPTATASPTASPSPTPVQVGVTVKEFTLTAVPLTAAVGNVQFNATNQGAIAHEVVVLKTDLPSNALPRRAGIDRVDEESSGEVIGEIEDTELGAGQSANGVMNLPAGRYVLLCNLEGHYTAGMYTSFTVGGVSPATNVPTVAPTAAPTAASLPQSGGPPSGDSTPIWFWLAAGVLVFGVTSFGWVRLVTKRRS